MDDLDLPDEDFSMKDLEKDLKKSRGTRRLPWLLTGLVLGIAGTILIPRFAGPYLPAVLRGSPELLSGPVLEEERDGDRLLLTIETEAGALIASFTERVAEIGMLVEPGDLVTIAVPDYEPFVENPDFEGVKKGAGISRPDSSAPAADSAAARGAGTDTAVGRQEPADGGVGAIGDSATGRSDTVTAEPDSSVADPDTVRTRPDAAGVRSPAGRG